MEALGSTFFFDPRKHPADAFRLSAMRIGLAAKAEHSASAGEATNRELELLLRIPTEEDLNERSETAPLLPFPMTVEEVELAVEAITFMRGLREPM